jgi:hypothetical protein
VDTDISLEVDVCMYMYVYLCVYLCVCVCVCECVYVSNGTGIFKTCSCRFSAPCTIQYAELDQLIRYLKSLYQLIFLFSSNEINMIIRALENYVKM